MGLFELIKKVLKGDRTETKSFIATNDRKEKQPSIQHRKYIKTLTKVRYNQTDVLKLHRQVDESWESFFSQKKENPKFVGFTHRSRRKFRHLFHDEKSLVTEAAKTIEHVTKEEVTRLSYKETSIDKFRAEKANERAVILRNQQKIALVHLENGKTYVYDFDWKPFTLAMGEHFWLVGTRETYNGPGELYCFDYNGKQKWAITFTETFLTGYGELTFMPYLLEVSSDSTDIFVASMDRLYRLDTDGNLKARIAISELKQKDLEEKYKDLNAKLSREPKSQEEAIRIFAETMAAQFSLGFELRDVNSPFSSFAHDPATDMLFVMESKGRISAWDRHGTLQWVNSFKQGGHYLHWLDDKLVASFETGETFWMDRDGQFIYGAKLPKEAASISLIPNKNTYLIVCDDHRLYELNKETGELIKGAEGHPGMKLFQIEGHNIFFDGEGTAQGYFWLDPEGKEWQHFEAKTIQESDQSVIQQGVAPEITATHAFSTAHVMKSKDDWFGGRIIDVKRERVYVVEQGPRADIQEYAKMTETQKNKDRLNHYLRCYDFNENMLWEKQMYSTMWSLYASPDKQTLFTSVPSKVEITYKPGMLYILSSEGTELKKIKVSAQGFHLDFLSNKKAIITFAAEKGKGEVGFLEEIDGKWKLTIDEEAEKEKSPFGAGIHSFTTKNFTLERTDKKKYILKNNEKEVNLNLRAAIYEAYETTDEKIALRIGTRLVTIYNAQLEKELEIKEEQAIQTFSIGNKSITIVNKEEIRGYSMDGELQWRYSSIPKAKEFQVHWFPNQNLYVWEVANSHESIIASITEQGEVIKSQTFPKQAYHRDIQMFPEQDVFVAQTNESIEVYGIK